MENLLCTRCKKNIASVFFTRMERGKPVEERLCFKCARELGMPQVGEMMQKLGLTDEDLENMSAEMMAAMEGNFPDTTDTDDEEEKSSNTATFPFLDKLFGTMRGGDDGMEQPRKTAVKEPASEKKKKYKFLDTYCVSLNDKAKEGRMDRLVGRGTETPEERTRRLATARMELAAAPEFDHVVVNADLGETVETLVSLLGLSATPSMSTTPSGPTTPQ